MSGSLIALVSGIENESGDSVSKGLFASKHGRLLPLLRTGDPSPLGGTLSDLAQEGGEFAAQPIAISHGRVICDATLAGAGTAAALLSVSP